MGLYNFQPRFVPFILSGETTHTIRAIRKHPDQPGNTLYLYQGLRTKKAKKLLEAECVKVEHIEIDTTFEMEGPERGKFAPQVWIGEPGPLSCDLLVDGKIRNGDCVRLSLDEREQLAHRDGFSSFAEMMRFWDGRLPFTGHIIHWKFDGRRKEKTRTPD